MAGNARTHDGGGGQDAGDVEPGAGFNLRFRAGFGGGAGAAYSFAARPAEAMVAPKAATTGAGGGAELIAPLSLRNAGAALVVVVNCREYSMRMSCSTNAEKLVKPCITMS